jgi:uncharacterized protein YbaP (TraB family)
MGSATIIQDKITITIQIKAAFSGSFLYFYSMRNSIFFAGFILLFISCTTTKKTVQSNKEISFLLDKPLQTNNSLFWQISGNGLTKPSFLFGTIHIISQEDYFLGKNVLKKLQHSEELIEEIDLNNMNIDELTKLSVLENGKFIKEYMNDTDYNILKTFMEDSIGIKKFTFENAYGRFKPFYIEQLIYINYIGQNKESYEENFKKIAEDKNIPVSGLESFEEQLRFLEDIPVEDQMKSMVKTIKNYTGETQRLTQLINDYKVQNLNALTASFEEDEDQITKVKLVDKRNSKWIPKLKTSIQNKSCFIAVGAGHLGGENGLINLLRKQGYTVDPISTN